MSAVEHLAANMPARGVWHQILRCKYCRERFGTDAAFEIHRPRPGKCRTERTLLNAGAWQGFGGIWWTADGGYSDEPRNVTFPGRNSLNLQGWETAGNSRGKAALSTVTRRLLCAGCRREFRARAHSKTKFCSSRCKQRAYRQREQS